MVRGKGAQERKKGGTGRRIGGLGEILRIFEEKAQRSRKGASATEFIQVFFLVTFGILTDI